MYVICVCNFIFEKVEKGGFLWFFGLLGKFFILFICFVKIKGKDIKYEIVKLFVLTILFLLMFYGV